MPKVKVNDITINYDQQGSGEPLILIPYLQRHSREYMGPFSFVPFVPFCG